MPEPTLPPFGGPVHAVHPMYLAGQASDIAGRNLGGRSPLHGVTILLLEDSRYASEAMRLICQRSGARLRRAASVSAARQHLRCYRPDVVLADLSLPDGESISLIREMSGRETRPVLRGISGQSDACTQMLAAGADGFIEKPVASLAAFQETLLNHLARVAPPSPRDGTHICPDPLAMRDDLRHALDMLSSSCDDRQARFITDFIEGIGRLAGDADLTLAAREARAGGIGALPRLCGVVERLIAIPLSQQINPRAEAHQS